VLGMEHARATVDLIDYGTEAEVDLSSATPVMTILRLFL